MKEVQHIINKNKEAAATPDGIVVIGKNYSVVVFNEAASRITGFTQRDVLNKDASILFQNCPEGLSHLESSFNDKTSFTNLSLDLTTKKSICKSVVASFTPIVDDEKVLSVVFVFRDIFEMIKMSETLEKRTVELIEQKNKLDAIFNSNIEGTFTINGDWEITSFNASAQRITGYSMEEAIGQKCWSIFASGKCQNGCHMELTMSKGKGTIGNELEIVRKDGKRIPIRVNSATLLDNNKKNMGAVETFLDISEIKNLENHLSEKYNFSNIIGSNMNLCQALSLLESVSQSDSTVVVTEKVAPERINGKGDPFEQ
ncbi:MAG: PAS domain-containing protein [Ignavibacteriales bacterium]|nr:PAS domain-containing protein [Ignavibacteriales bacterium]